MLQIVGRNNPLRRLHCTSKEGMEPCGWKVQAGSLSCTQAYQCEYDFSRGVDPPRSAACTELFFSLGVICGTAWQDINSLWCGEKIGTFKGLYLSSFPSDKFITMEVTGLETPVFGLLYIFSTFVRVAVLDRRICTNALPIKHNILLLAGDKSDNCSTLLFRQSC